MQVINKKIIAILICVSIFIFGLYKLFNKEKIVLDDVKLDIRDTNNTFAIYLENGYKSNNYEESSNNEFPSVGYSYNGEKSQCVSIDGSVINNVLSYEENVGVSINTNKTVYCYIYFDRLTLGDAIKVLEPKGLNLDTTSNSEDWTGMYRFQGQQSEGIENYICFGTSNSNECKTYPEKYMYRIIGIEENGRIKVIKKDALNKTYAWWNNSNDDIKWPNSLVYQAINGPDFLENTDYIPKGWEDKIVDNEWLYGDMWNTSQKGLSNYLIEIGQNKALWYEKSDNGKIAKNEVWTSTKTSKINLMYLSDYYLAISDTAICVYNSQDTPKLKICKSSWIHLSQNDKDNAGSNEFLSTRMGYRETEGDNNLWITVIYARGYVLGDYNNCVVRPVFYIDASQTLLSGLGKPENPYIIKE